MRPLHDVRRYADYTPLDIRILRQDLDVSPEALEPRLVLEDRRDGIVYQEYTLGLGPLGGERAHIHCRRARPADAPARLPMLLIPGGRGRIPPETAVWTARYLKADVLGLDWLCVGQSSPVRRLNPYPEGNAFLFEGTYRDSFQFFNIKALWSAFRFLLSVTEAEPARAAVMGGSWGAFYAFLLACLDPDIRFLFPTFGCGYLDHETRHVWDAAFRTMGPEKTRTWIEAFDPGRRMGLITARTYFCTATNDKFFGMPSAMRSLANLGGPTNSLLVHNQDHFTNPYGINAHNIINLLEAGRGEAVPDVDSVAFDRRTNTAAATLRENKDMDVSFIVSHGQHTKSFGRCWRRVPASFDGQAWTARLPLFEDRQAWFYALAENTRAHVAGSSSIHVLDPGRDFDQPRHRMADIQRLDYVVDTEEVLALPVGDRIYPLASTGRDEKGPFLQFRFDATRQGMGVFYALDGDIIARRGFDALELELSAEVQDGFEHLSLTLVTDYHAYEQQCYGLPLEGLVAPGGGWETVEVRFSDFRPLATTQEFFGPYPRRPLDPGRICGVGLFNARPNCRGTVGLRRVCVFKGRARPQGGAFDPAELERGLFVLPCALDRQALAERLRPHGPWRMEVQFENGFSTAELEKSTAYYTKYPLAKLLRVLKHLDAPALSGGRALDIGCNTGYNCFHLRRALGMEALGVDILPRHIEVARLFAEMSGLDGLRFDTADANHFRLGEPFDLIVHFGALDHLRHPFLALEHASAMLRAGGWLALETQIFHSQAGETLLNRFVPKDYKGDSSCWWFLDRETVLAMLKLVGFHEISIVSEWRNDAVLGPDMRRLCLVARKE